MTKGTITRRMFTALALTTALALPSASMAEQIELTILSHPTFSPQASLPAVAELYQEVWDKFEADTGIKLKMEPFSGSTEALQDILTRGTAGRLSDVGVMDTFWVPRLHASGYLQPLDDVLTAEDKADFLGGVLEATTHDGALRAIYIYNPWRGLYYRPSVLKELGYDAPPTDWDEFLEFGRKVREAGYPNAVMLPASMSELTMQYLYTQYLGLGGEITDDTGKPSFFEPGNREKLEQVYEMWRELITEGLMPTEVGTMAESDTRPYFYTGETVLLGASTSSIKQMYTDVPSLVGDMNVSPMPLPGDASPVPLLAAWSYVMFTNDPARQEAASKFISYMLSPEVLGRLNLAQGHIPMRQSIWDTYPEFAEDPLMQRLYTIMNDPRIRERSIFPVYPAIKDAITGQMAGVIAGTTTPAEAVDNAGAEAMAAYERMEN